LSSGDIISEAGDDEMKIIAREESGYEELLRLSREVSIKEKEYLEEMNNVRGKIRRAKKKEILQNVLNDIQFSLVLEKLKSVATSRIYNEACSYSDRERKVKLHKLVLDIAGELEETVNRLDDSTTDLPLIKQLVKTLAILVEFLLYIEKSE
jgi:hypothetical protein